MLATFGDVRFGSKADMAIIGGMSALPPKADVAQHGCNVHFVPEFEELTVCSPVLMRK